MISFHVLAIPLSRSDATGRCEYLFHLHRSGYSVVIHFRTDRSATLLFKFKTLALRCRGSEASNRSHGVQPATRVSGTSSIARDNEQIGKYHDFHENCLSTAGGGNLPVFQGAQKLRLDALRFVLVRRRTMKYKTAKTATKRMIQCESVFTILPSHQRWRSGPAALGKLSRPPKPRRCTKAPSQ